MIQFNVMFRTGDRRREREKSVGIGKSSHKEESHQIDQQLVHDIASKTGRERENPRDPSEDT